MDLITMLTMIKETGLGIIEGVVLFYVAWGKLRPYADEKLRVIQHSMESKLGEMSQSIDSLGENVKELAGRVVAHEKRQDERWNNHEERLVKIEKLKGE
jgi:hypothetical protein